MNCTACRPHSCRDLEACPTQSPLVHSSQNGYEEPSTQATVQAASQLVDEGLAGQLSRLEELARFIEGRGYSRPGLAYCYGLEKEARQVTQWFRSRGIRASAVSCTVGALAQSVVNQASDLPGVSCNPLAQAAQLEADGVDLAIPFGLCLGHDILFAKAFPGDQTVLVVKDRVHHHAPLEALKNLPLESL